MREQDYDKIVSILEQVFGCSISATFPENTDLSLDSGDYANSIAIVKDLIANQHLLTSDHVNGLIVEKIKLPVAGTMITSYADYAAQLADTIAGVKYRVAANYEYQKLLPDQQQLFALHNACIRFTGNSAHFYLHYIQMCELANIVRYKYQDLRRCVAADNLMSILDMAQRNDLSELYFRELLEPYVRQGGILAHGRSDIDATSISNLFYYKHAKLILYYQMAKDLIVQTMQVADYAQLAQAKREQLWQALQDAFPADTAEDRNNIFYKFCQYINQAPGELYNHFSSELHGLSSLSDAEMHRTIQYAGLKCNQLVLIGRTLVENWHPKRFLSLCWQRKYPLALYTTAATVILRNADSLEQIRIWPNELPYFPGHGLTICGNGLIEGYEEYGTAAYEWNMPQDPTAQISNVPRDVEKLFREMQLFDSPTNPINIFQNPISYSSIQNTQHCHLIKGTIECWPLYLLPAASIFRVFDASFELVPVGDLADAFYLRVVFASLDNEQLIKGLIDLNAHLHEYYNGHQHLDAEMHIFRHNDEYVFIYEPHARLELLQNGNFYNPDIQQQTYRKPQYFVPSDVDMPLCTNLARRGREYLKEYFDKTYKLNILQVMRDYISQQNCRPE